MVTVLPIPTGPTNREFIDRAYRSLGLSDSMFARTDEEYATGMDLLASMMLESPFDKLGFISGSEGEGNRVEDESGIDRKWLNAVGLCLAEHLAPMIGRTLAPAQLKAKNRAYSLLCAEIVEIPDACYADGTPRGAGARYRNTNGHGPFFPEGDKEGATSTSTDAGTDTDSVKYSSYPPV